MGFGSVKAENETLSSFPSGTQLTNFVASTTATNGDHSHSCGTDALLIHMFVCISWSWSPHLVHSRRKNLTSLSQSKMLLPSVLPPEERCCLSDGQWLQPLSHFLNFAREL